MLLHSQQVARVHWEALDSPASVSTVLEGLRLQEDPAVLESTAVHETFGRWSLLACRPLEVIVLEGGRLLDSRGEVLAEGAEAFWPALARAFSCVAMGERELGERGLGKRGLYPAPSSRGLSPFSAPPAKGDSPPPKAGYSPLSQSPFASPPYEPGWIGYVGYEVGRLVERLPGRAVRDTHFPDLRLAFYDAIALHDSLQNRWYLSHLSFDPSRPTPPHAGEAADILRRIVMQADPRGEGVPPLRSESRCTSGLPSRVAGVSPASAANTLPTAEAVSNFAPDDYLRAVARCIEYIAAGDIFQVNLSQRLTVPHAPPPWDIYRALRRRNPAWYAAYLAFEHAGSPCAIASSSPELFLRVRGREVLTRPIKGTRPRIGEPAADAQAAAELQASPKDNAELTMIVDLLRNDLGRVCEYGSVRVEEARRLEAHPTVFHLVGTVRGRLREGVDASALLRATFPGGSITGAPKIRAMEIIDELEPVARGVYTGCIGWVGVGGDSEWNIAIRTVVCEAGRAHVQVGGGIVADSQPQAEYQETLDKARALLEAIAQARTA